MNWWHELKYLIRKLDRRRAERELEEEIQTHLELETREQLRDGASPEEARYAARRAFGSVVRAKEESRAGWGFRTGDTLWQDLRYGWRMLIERPGFTIVAVLSMALGIGANTAIFSLADAMLWRALPGAGHDRLMTLVRGNGDGQTWSYPDFLDYRDRNRAFEGLAAYQPTTLAFGDSGRSAVVLGEMVTGAFFEVLGVPMARGRAFLPVEDRLSDAPPVAVISHDFWQRRLGGDPQVIGRTLLFNQHGFTVIGVATPGFTGASIPMRAEAWVLMASREVLKPTQAAMMNDRHASWLWAVGRLKAGVSREQAEAELETINRQLQQAYPEPNRPNPNGADFQSSRRLTLTPARGTLLQELRQMTMQAAGLAAAVVGLVLLIACANVANLLLARGAARQREMAIRLAVGAGRRRLIRQLLTESLLLASLGGAAGLLLAFWLNQLLMSFQPPFPPPMEFQAELRLDGRVLGFTLLLTMLTGAIFGLAPALAATKPDLIPALKGEARASGGRRRFALRHLLVVVQVALSLVLLIGSGLFVRSLSNVQAIDPGFETDNGLVVGLNLGLQGYDEERGRQFYRQLVERLESLPGVRSITLASYIPLGFMAMDSPVTVEGRPPSADGRPIFAMHQQVGLRYFETMETPLLRGRDFTAQDTVSSASVVIVNQTLARRYWPNLKDLGEVIGRRIRIGPDSNAAWSVIVGVAGDCKYFGIGEAQRDGIWTPLSQKYAPSFQALVRTTTDTTGIVPALRGEIAALDPDLPIQSIMTLRDQVGLWLWPAKMSTSLVTALGAFGLLLAVIGLYGVMSYAVAQRTREIGIRMALGAQPRNVLSLIVRHGMRLTLAGVALGLAAAFAVMRLVVSLLYNVSVRDPLTFIVVPFLLTIIAGLACYIPARRATKVNPTTALRQD